MNKIILINRQLIVKAKADTVMFEKPSISLCFFTNRKIKYLGFYINLEKEGDQYA